MAHPLITVVIPSFNHAKYLDRCLNSLMNQSYINWEAVIVDNYSSDNTDLVISKYKDARINFLKNNNHGIIAVSRNIGINNAKGSWIAFLDSDDWWSPNKLEVCVDYINDSVDLIYHDLIAVKDTKNYFNKSSVCRQVCSPVLHDLLVYGNTILNSSVFVRKEILDKVGGINENRDIVAAEDYHTWLRIAQITNNFIYIPMQLGYYFIHNCSVSKKNMAIPMRNAIQNFQEILNINDKKKLYANIKYIDGRFNYLNKYYHSAIPSLFFAIKNGNFIIKFKSIFMIFIIYLSFVIKK